ncbi:Protein N-acetyltransferase, RimJ/RimL family [Paracoccus saliphilus]|nr:Protein N-acetyltransferase, RimJ/RimL family [Paracoccus saliphilus]
MAWFVLSLRADAMHGRISLSRAFPEDCDAIVEAMQNPEMGRWLTSIPQPYGLNDAAQFVAEAGADEYAIRVDGQMAGMLRVADSFGIWVASRFQRQGVALRAAVLGLSRCFLAGADGIDAVYLNGNHRSEMLLSRLGFRAKGQVTAWSRALAKELPATSLHLTRADFAARHGIALNTPHLRISGFRPSDLIDLHRIVTRPEVCRMLLRFAPDMTVDDVAPIFTAESLVPPMRLVIRHKGQVAGAVGILPGDPPSINYFLDPSLAGMGLGQEAASAFMNEYLLRFDPPELQAEVFDDNPASARILRNLGFQRVEDISCPSLGREAAAPAGIYRWRRSH